mmetsp:Transcript_3127/g.4166  ORF Transcript_3127/g.4166 Transcript_3127/m.4166 type:complete len:252 (+) Transcript_3127:805-1560(+)
MGVIYKNDSGVKKIKKIEKKHTDIDYQGRYQVTTTAGSVEYDYLVLANGVFTPLLATQLSMAVGASCPVYPLKGYSLTLCAASDQTRNLADKNSTTGTKENFLKTPLSFDHMYCTSVGPDMVRLAGFGEIKGFPKKEDYDEGPGVAKNVLNKYASNIFGRELKCGTNLVIPCFRPITPDDLPLAGSVKHCPGLYFHTGHGTLGWTLSLATADCVAQAVCDDIERREDDSDSYILPDNTTIPKRVLSPNRFV